MNEPRPHKRPARNDKKKTKRKKEEGKKKKEPSSSASASIAVTTTTTGTCVPVSRYEKIGRLGQGTYGIVYQARDTVTSRIVALKRCIPHHQQTDGFPVTTLREIENLRGAAPCPHIVRLLDVAVSKHAVFLVLEYCQHDLASLLDDHYEEYHRSPFREEACKTLLRHLLTALAFLHARHVLHRDVKMSNLLYHQGMLKLADFGLSRHTTTVSALTCKVASLWYRAPEVVLEYRHKYSAGLDIWATGCAWAELLQGRPLFPAKNDLDQIQQIHEQIGIPVADLNPSDYPVLNDVRLEGLLGNSDKKRQGHHRKFRVLDSFGFLSEAGCQMLTSLLQFHSEQRWTAEQALRSPYFSESPQPVPVSQMPRFPN